MSVQSIFCIDIPRPGFENMELDWQNLLRAEKSPVPCTVIRFYSWDEPTVSLGKHQTAEEAVDIDYCRKKGIPVVHRPTGGRAVFHKDEITYAVVSNSHRLFPLQSISGTYALIAEALRRGLSVMGIRAESFEGAMSQRDIPHSSRRRKPCFVTPSRYEVIFERRKLAGSAQRRLKRSFLQHGSIALTIDYPEMSRVLGYSEDLLRRRMLSLSEAAKRDIDFSQAARSIQMGFEQILKLERIPLERLQENYSRSQT